MAESAVDCLLKTLQQMIMSCMPNLITDEDDQDQLLSLYQDLKILRPIFRDTEEKCYANQRIQNLVKQIRGAAFTVQVSNNIRLGKTHLRGVREEIKAIAVEFMDIYDQMCDVKVLQNGPSPRCIGPSRANKTSIEEEIVVGFEDEAIAIKQQLTGGGKKQLEFVSIVGMPGLGKTTLARKIYSDPYITHYFHIRAWTHVSQVYSKQQLLLEILASLIDLTDEVMEMSIESLGVKLYKRLKGKRFLIVMDDIWSVGAWNDVKVYLPNDNMGSKVLFTSRLKEVALNPYCLRFLTEEESWDLLQEKVFQKENCPSELMEIGNTIVRKCEGLPLAIVVMAGLLAKKEKTKEWWRHVAGCVRSYIVKDPNQYMNTLALSYDHLPRHLKPCFLYLGAFRDDREIHVPKLLMLWIAEGFIQKTERKTLEDVAEDYLMDLIERNLVIVARRKSNGRVKFCCMHDLLRDLCLKKAQEFNFLERRRDYKHASSSFLSEEPNGPHHILAREGGTRRLCIHSDFLNFEGISTSIHPSIIRSFLCLGNSGRICLSNYHNTVDLTASVYNFFSRLNKSDKRVRYFLKFFGSRDAGKEHNNLLFQKTCHLCVDGCSFLKGSDPSLWLSYFYYGSSLDKSCYSSLLKKSLVDPWLCIFRTFKLLKVLDLWCPNVFFSSEILQLVHLRYLAIQFDDFYTLSPSISNLSNLETLILGMRWSHVIIPNTIWKMVKLRNLYSKGGQYHINYGCFQRVPMLIDGYSFLLENLQTVSNLCPGGPVLGFLGRTPNLRKLGFCGHLISESKHLKIPDLRCLRYLENLKLDNRALVKSSNLQQIMFPEKLRSLTLRGTRIKWEEMWMIGILSNLEVLKLEINACQGSQWETTGWGFRRLKFLKFKLLDVEQWIVSSTHFPSLQKLVLESCVRLKRIPSCLGDILTLQMIHVKNCSPFAEQSARIIKTEQNSIGNNQLKILINNQEFSGITYQTESPESESEED